MARVLLGIPVYNEAQYVNDVLCEVRKYIDDVLVIDDGSTDETPELLARHGVEVIRHCRNLGYGRAMRDMIERAAKDNFDWLITMDCDLQHEPASIPAFRDAIARDDSDVISGSRYLCVHPENDAPPAERQSINREITTLLNERLGLGLTDAFCGFKAYRIAACAPLKLDLDGYEFPMQFWTEAWCANLRITEIPVRLIYNDPSRTFGGPLDDADHRREVYLRAFQCALSRCESTAKA